MTGRETGSDALERAKTTVRWSENLADPSDTVLLPRTGSPEKRENAHPCLRKNRGRLLWCPQTKRNAFHTFAIQNNLSAIGAIETMGWSRHFCQQTTNQAQLQPMLVSLL